MDNAQISPSGFHSTRIDELRLLDESSIPGEFDQAGFNNEMRAEIRDLRFEDEDEEAVKMRYRRVLMTVRECGSAVINNQLSARSFVETYYEDLRHIMENCIKTSDYTALLRIGNCIIPRVIRCVLWKS